MARKSTKARQHLLGKGQWSGVCCGGPGKKESSIPRCRVCVEKDAVPCVSKQAVRCQYRVGITQGRGFEVSCRGLWKGFLVQIVVSKRYSSLFGWDCFSCNSILGFHFPIADFRYLIPSL